MQQKTIPEMWTLDVSGIDNSLVFNTKHDIYDTTNIS